MSRHPLPSVVVAAIMPALLGTFLIGLIIGEWWHLLGYTWYFLPGTVVPQEPAVMYAGTLYNPGLVVVLFSLATMTASLIDYCTVKKLLEFRQLAPLKRTSFYRAAVSCFYWRPWLAIVVFAFSPLPFFPIRILALSSGYPLFKYVSANVVGRMPRYYLLAVGGAWLTVPTMYLFVMAAVLALVPVVGVLLSRRNPVRLLVTTIQPPL